MGRWWRNCLKVWMCSSWKKVRVVLVGCCWIFYGWHRELSSRDRLRMFWVVR